MLTLKMKKTAMTVTFILISGRSGEPLTSSNAASNHRPIDVRPTSQCQAVSQLCFLQPLTTADDDDFLDFSRNDCPFLCNISTED